MNKLSWDVVDDLTGWMVKLRQKNSIGEGYPWSFMVVCFSKNGCIWGPYESEQNQALWKYNELGNGFINALSEKREDNYEIIPIRKIF